MSETISKHIAEGFGKGELYAALAYDETDVFGGMKIKGISFSPVAGKPAINVGDSTTAWTALYTDKAISIYSTCASVNASTSFEPVLFYTTLTGIGQVGGRVRAFMTTNVALGGWSNAFKAEVTYGAAGRTTGLGSALLAEMTLSAGTSSGTYAPLEIELNLGTGALTGTATSLIYMSVNGADASTFDTNGFLFTLAGLTGASGKALYNNTLKAKIGTTTWYLPLSSAEGSYTSAYPIALTNTLTVGVDGTGHDVKFFGDTAGCSLLYDQSEDQLVITQTNAATTGTERTLDVSQTHTGIGASAEAFRSVITTNVAGGTYMNAVFGKIDFSTVGKVTGLAGVICAELTMAGGAVSQGTYATFEAEINLPTSYSSSVPISVLRIGTWGAVKTSFDTYGYLLDIDGPAVGSGKFFQVNTAAAATHALRVRIGGVAYYVMLTDTGA